MYTRTGDKGKTMLIGGEKVWKDHPRVEAYGTVDELNSTIGTVLSLSKWRDVNRILTTLQSYLFTVGAELATPANRRPNVTISSKDTARIEKWIDVYNKKITPIFAFVHPTGKATGAFLHLARSIARRAERRVVSLSRTEQVNPNLIAFLNRLSSLLFVLSRYANERDGWKEIAWKPHH